MKSLPKNMGVFDRACRALVVAPAGIAVAFLAGPGTLAGIVLFVVAGLMLTTAATGFCPTYALLGIATRPNGLHRTGHRLGGGHV